MSRILIVDDDDGIRENLELRLKANKYDTVSVKNGGEAVEAVSKDKHDLVLLDVMMPGIDGFETCRLIKEKVRPEFVPVIMLTALKHVEEKVRGLEAGADDFVSKPFNNEELLARINAFLRIKALHDELDTSYKKLKKLEDVKDSLIQLIIHDLRSPVSSIIATLSLFKLKHEQAMDPEVENVISKIKRNCELQIDMINDILEVSRMENEQIKLEKTEINTAELIEECLAQINAAALKRSIKLEKILDEKSGTVNADKNYLRRVVMNLLNNSMKYTDDNGVISVSVKYDDKEKNHVFSVRDNGQGIPEGSLDKIFGRFFQADVSSGRSRKGVGLGLFYCRMAVEAHGGRIWAESKENEGSSFNFIIPG